MIRHIVSFPAPHSHYASIETRIPMRHEHEIEVFLPVWTPGSYLVREYARNIESLTAVSDGQPCLDVCKTRKNRWRISSDDALDEVIISYQLYCHELSVRTNWVDENFALLVGAATLLCPVNGLSSPHEVTLKLPGDWAGSWSGMDGENNCFTAPDYDTLVDCPIVAGSPSLNGFVFDDVPHLLVSVGSIELWDGAKAIADVRRIVEQHRSMWGSLPYRNYVFLNLLTGAGGGLEHRNSMVVMADRFAMRTRSSHIAWLDLISHEFFHVWNVKRLRPVELGPFDYENEVYTNNLWIAEGFTEYYGLLALRRAGLITDEEFLGTEATLKPGQASSLSAFVERLQTTPGRLRQPVSLASFDAWIKLYRPDENSVNCTISYYTKGAIIAWLLDARIRMATSGAQTLDHVMHLAYARYSSERGFTSDEFLSLVQELTNRDVMNWLNQTVTSGEELDYTPALAWFGLRFKAAKTSTKAWCGFTTKSIEGRLMITQVPHGTPASNAGISPDDEILGIDDYRVRPDQWEQRMEQYQAGQDVTLLLSRRDRLIHVTVSLAREPGQIWRLEVDPTADSDKKHNYANW